MVAKKPRIVIIGAGMAGLTAANKLYTSSSSNDMFELCVVEGGPRIGGRINTSEFGGDRIEMGATWIHGIGGSPVHKIAQEIHSLESEQPWECMDGFLDEPKTVAEGGFELSPSLVESISTLFKSLMDYAQGKLIEREESSEEVNFCKLADKICPSNGGGPGKLSVGSFLRKALNVYWDSVKEQEQIEGCGIGPDSGMFKPPLPSFKTEAISRLGFGVVNKLFLQLSSRHDGRDGDYSKFPFLQMAFHRPDSEWRHKKIPWWMRRTASLSPIYKNSGVLLSWFAGKEALELETLSDEEIIEGVSTTLSSFSSQPHKQLNSNSHGVCNGKEKSVDGNRVRFAKVLKSKWGNDPLFLGSYSYVAVGSSGDDLDTLAEPLPNPDSLGSAPLQILFAGEATHRTHYSTTHGAYFSGLREASRLLQHYHCVGV
ncbi:hypothetical protein D5086_013091 [Populus alba]|uniref:Uncharacterized protein n=1 Tax=Populus alba TaxID=43335 RepID=A0ACC4C3Z2_POPAL